MPWGTVKVVLVPATQAQIQLNRSGGGGKYIQFFFLAAGGSKRESIKMQGNEIFTVRLRLITEESNQTIKQEK